ncbi:hypothetical protein EWM64_g8710 [Hericium alpestre]|uniref:Uncharacterized protein n=1 Tax=Hericium alpestre TaxID=135208 RepID=A0A4Y9ZN86_9AGAM|nr:hypothetical protein EWM64_g8710 [Hericium alpestre]
MPAVDPLTTIPEIAKVGIMICQVVELQSNSHKLATLKSAFTKITPLVVEADRLAPFQNSNDWMQIHNEVAEITTSYQKLLKWVGELNKAQRFVKFWEIRKEIRSLWDYIERASFRIRNANLTSGLKEDELKNKKQHLSTLMTETETGMTASEALQRQVKVLDLKIKFEKTLSDLVKAAKDMQNADDEDLQAYMAQRSFVAMSTLANMNGSTSLADKRKVPPFACLGFDEPSFVTGTGEEPIVDDISINATLNVDPDFTVDVEGSSSFKFCTIS